MTIARRMGVKSALVCLALLALPAPSLAFSTEDPDGDGFVLMPAKKRYYALPKADKPARPLRSDMDLMKRGFMRIDRSPVNTVRAASLSATNVRTVRPAERPEVALIRQLEAEAAKPQPVQPKREHNGKLAHIWPVPSHIEQYVSSGYGMRRDPFHGRLAFHGGLDIAAAPGTPILVTADGIVKEVGRKGGYGNYVLVSHADGSESMYNHLQRAETRVGARVIQGQVIARLGSTGRSTGPHLDYRIKQGSHKIDPMIVLAGKQPSGMQLARNTIPTRGIKAHPEVRMQNGVRVVTPRLSPQERVAMGGGFIQVR